MKLKPILRGSKVHKVVIDFGREIELQDFMHKMQLIRNALLTPQYDQTKKVVSLGNEPREVVQVLAEKQENTTRDYLKELRKAGMYPGIERAGGY